MNNYLLTLVLKSEQDEKARKELLDDIKKIITGTDGKIEKEDLWGNRDLAYPIKRQTKGFYAHFEFETDPKNAKGLDKALKVQEDVIRHLLIRR
jgi:small subunit ribosomal protein S6